MTLKIDYLYYEECPSHAEGLERLQEVLAEEGIEAAMTVRRVETQEEAKQLRFVGSPTIRINGQDIDPESASRGQYALTCRTYVREDGRFSPLPSRESIRRAVRAAARKTGDESSTDV